MTRYHRMHRLIAAAALTGLGLALTACGNSGTAQTPTATVTLEAEGQTGPTTAEEPTATDTPAADAAEGQLPADWPDDDFPVPAGVTVTKGEDASGFGMVLVGKSPDEVTSFYRSALPAAGYEITRDNSVGAGGIEVIGMEFAGNGYVGELGVVNDTVAISLHQG